MPSGGPIFDVFFIFHLMKLRTSTGGNQSVLISNFRSKMWLRKVLILKTTHMCCFCAFFHSQQKGYHGNTLATTNF